MPEVRLIEKSDVQRTARRRAGEHIQKERETARTYLRQAKESGKAIELSLDAGERDETIKARYRSVAREEQLRIRFQTAAQRTYQNRKGRQEREAEVMIVMVS